MTLRAVSISIKILRKFWNLPYLQCVFMFYIIPVVSCIQVPPLDVLDLFQTSSKFVYKDRFIHPQSPLLKLHLNKPLLYIWPERMSWYPIKGCILDCMYEKNDSRSTQGLRGHLEQLNKVSKRVMVGICTNSVDTWKDVGCAWCIICSSSQNLHRALRAYEGFEIPERTTKTCKKL